MTRQDVDPETYYAIGQGLFDKAGELYDAFDVNVAILGGTGSMAGTDDAGTAWAASYDARAVEVLGAVNDLTKAMENYGGVVIQAGYNHAIAEHNATPANRGPAPTKPPEPVSVVGVLSATPSAGGPGKGLIDAIGLMQQVGVPVPDGDTGGSPSPLVVELDGSSTLLSPKEDSEGALAPIRNLVGRAVVTAIAGPSGALDVAFEGGTRLYVEPDPAYEAWNVSGPDGALVVSMPGGELAIWSAQPRSVEPES